MKYLQSYNLFEKSSLTALGVPNEVMREIQYNYELKPDAEWIRLGYKKDLIEELKKDEKAFFLEISDKYIKVIVNLTNNEYFIQYFNYDDAGWGKYESEEREMITRTQLLIGVNPKNIIYKLEGIFQERPKAQRKVQKEIKELDETTNEFKFYILYNFNKIVKRIYGKRFDEVMKKIANNIATIKEGSTADEILIFLRDNKKLAEKAKEYEDAKTEDDILKIQELEQKYNSLPVIDEYLINFEVGYSDKFKTRLNIKQLIDTFNRMKIETAFMYYLYTGKLADIRIEKHKLVQAFKKNKFQ